MAKSGKASKPAAKSKSEGTADYHRKLAQTYSAKARIHGAQADLADAKNPPKKGAMRGGPYSY